MNQIHKKSRTGAASRREFLTKSTAAIGASVAGSLGIARSAHAAGDDVIKIALIGCGARGAGAAVNALSTKANVKLVAMCDAFNGRLENSLRAIQSRCEGRVDVPQERRFIGLLGYKQAIGCGADMVLLCTPPGFRPMQFEAAVKAGKHVFMEKPVAVDAPGVRRIMAANEEAKKKDLVVAVGHHLRHETMHREVIKRLHDRIIGQISYMRAYFNRSGGRGKPRQPDQTEMQYQVSNWYYFTWLCGDRIVEQFVHNLDVMNWINSAHPVRANGMGGRQVCVDKDCGERFDHFAVEFDYADGSKLYGFTRNIPGCWNSFANHVHGTEGRACLQGFGRSDIRADAREPMRFKRGPNEYQVEMDELFAALLAGHPYNEGDYGATSTMTAIMGRMATYSGKIVSWDEAINSTLDLSPERYAWDGDPQPKPGKDGIYPCAMPGVTKAW